MAKHPVIHPLWVRIFHWGNALGVVILTLSGWRIYNASPLFNFAFPAAVTLGNGLAGALLWHFAVMWLLITNGLFYLAGNLATGRLWRTFFPLRPGQVLCDLLLAIKGELSHELQRYHALQRAVYLLVIADIMLVILSGLVLWKSVQFPLLRDLMGGYEIARRVHFFGMAALTAFCGVHLVMVVIVPRSLLTMLRGH